MTRTTLSQIFVRSHDGVDEQRSGGQVAISQRPIHPRLRDGLSRWRIDDPPERFTHHRLLVSARAKR